MSSTKILNEHKNQSRRDFLKTSTLALAGAAFAAPLSFPAKLKAKSPAEDPKKQLGVALIGCGAYGSRLLTEALRNHKKWNLAFPAVCDVWKPNLESAAKQIEAATGKMPAKTSKFTETLEREDVDCVIIATPDFSHTSILTAAADAGKALYVEKPMAVSIEQAEAAVEAVERNGTIFQVGTQFRSLPQFAKAAEIIQSGELGKILKVDVSYLRPKLRWDERNIENVRESDTDWDQFLMDLPKRPFDPNRLRMWRLFRDYTTGITGLLGTHVIDIAQWLTDSGPATSASGIEAWLTGQRSETADFQECLFTYENGMILNSSCRTGNSAPGSQINFYGTRGTLHCPYSIRATLTLSPEGASDDDPIEAREIKPKPAPGHLENWFDCIRKGTTETKADVHAGYAHSIASILATKSARTEKRVYHQPKSPA